MPNNPSEPQYFTYNAYIDARDRFKRSEHNSDDKARFRKIIDRISKKPDVPIWEEKLFTTLHKYLAVYNGFTIGFNDYCRYINFWLNEEIRKSGYEKYLKYFDFFKDFVDNYAYVNQGNYTKSCKAYIHNMEQGDYNRMKLLYDFFNLYRNVKSKDFSLSEAECTNLHYNTVNYNAGIDDYYDNHRDFYNKIKQVKILIEGKIKNLRIKCGNSLEFREAQNFLKDEREKKELARIAEERKKQEEDAARQRREAEEAERRIQEAEAAERQRRQRIQQDLVSQGEMPQMHTTHDTQREKFQQRESLGSVELENLGDTLHSETQETRLQQYKDQSEQIFHTSRNEHTSPDGSFLGSSGFPGYITEVFRSVEPAPILGVSGGMGALFLLFKYTPVGSFFGGRRGRNHRIPGSFGGHFPGEFPKFHEYDGGYIGYGAMNTSHLAE